MIQATSRSGSTTTRATVSSQPIPQGLADIWAVSFATTLAMWAIAYFCWLPRSLAGDDRTHLLVPAWLLLILLVACLVAGGYAAGRYMQRGVVGGLHVGALSAILNLMIVGSLLGGAQPAEVWRNAILWIPAWILFSGILGLLGAVVGVRRPYRGSEIRWSGIFAQVTVAAVLLLLLVGGMVTSAEAGLAVVDWPNSFGHFMFLLPLSRMTGGAYFEHSHRLIGSLVGLATLVLAIHLWRTDPRRQVRGLVALALLAVIIQGILGGLRVTGYFTTTTDPGEVAPNIYLAAVHGIFGQVVFALLSGIAVVTSATWFRTSPATDVPRRSTDRAMLGLLVVVLIVQLTIGALQRHMTNEVFLSTLAGTFPQAAARGALFTWLPKYTLILHVALGCIAVAWAAIAGVRAWGLYEAFPTLTRFGLGLIGLAGLQLLLGLGSLIVTGLRPDPLVQPNPPVVEVLITTLHQTAGALMLACAVAAALCVRREPLPDWRDRGFSPAG